MALGSRSKAAATADKKAAPKKGAATSPRTSPVVTATHTGPYIPGIKVATPNLGRGAEIRLKVLDALSKLKEDPASVIHPDDMDEVCPTGSIVNDVVLGLGGFPLSSRFTQVQGEEHSGKSTLMYGYAANFQRLYGEPVAILDHEQAVMPPYLRACGIDTSEGNLILRRPIDLDESIKLVMNLAKQGVRCFVFDSVPAMEQGVDEKKVNKGEGMDMRVGEHAAAFKQFLRLLRQYTRGCQCLFVNQIRSLIPQNTKDQNKIKYATIGDPAYVVPGGKAMKFWSSLTLETMKGKVFETAGDDEEWLFPEATERHDGARTWGVYKTNIRVLKNKITGGGYRQYHIYLRPGSGIDDWISVRELARDYDLIRSSSAGTIVGLDGVTPIASYKNKSSAIQALVHEQDMKVLIPLREMLVDTILKADQAAYAYERTARDRFLAGEIDAPEAKALGVHGAVDFEAETPGTDDLD
jgi:RecA/RadA recombinase